MNKKVRVRFAPSPTGGLHIGGVRTALYNYLFTRRHNGEFILRIEDTDRTRFVQGAEEYIKVTLNWLGLAPDEGPDEGGQYGPYKQSERKDIYKKYVKNLLEKGLAYYAFDTPEELEAMRKRQKEAGSSNLQYNAGTRGAMKNSFTLSKAEVDEKIREGIPYVIRIKMPAKERIVFHDQIRGEVAVNTEILDDKVILKSDGLPTYHLANVVDDHLMEITHVIRGEEWLPSTPLHVLLYRYLGWSEDMPQFAHMPLLLKPEGKGKLSKRDADKHGFPIFPLTWSDPQTKEESEGYREAGYLPDALINFLALLGWHPGSDQEIFSLDEMTEIFSIENIGKAGIRFDIQKAQWYNQEYIKRKPDEELSEILLHILKNENIPCSSEKALRIVALMKERVTFPQELYSNAPYFFSDPENYDLKIVRKKWNEKAVKALSKYKEALEKSSKITAEDAKSMLKNILSDLDLGMGKVMPALRLAITGVGGGPDLMGIIEVIGPETTARRINKAVSKLGSEINV